MEIFKLEMFKKKVSCDGVALPCVANHLMVVNFCRLLPDRCLSIAVRS